MKKKKGFTLVELLAVIVILAVILIIAVPQIISVIESARKGSIESTAKLIAEGAEREYTNRKILGKDTNIECSEVANLNDKDYGSCSITFDSTGKVTVSITGKGKFEGYTCVGNSTNMECTKGDPIPTDAQYFSYESINAIDGLGVTVKDKDKCVAYLQTKFAFDEENANTLCSGNAFYNGWTLKGAVKQGTIPSSDYETAGLKVGYIIDNIEVKDKNKCVAYLIKSWNDTSDEGKQDANTICSGNALDFGYTLKEAVQQGDIPTTDYETAGIKISNTIIYDIVIKDKDKCVAYLPTIGASEEQANTICSGNALDNGWTIKDDVLQGNIPSSDYETAGLEVTSEPYIIEITITDYDSGFNVEITDKEKCKTYVKENNIDNITNDSTIETLCTGEVDFGRTIARYVSNNSIPKSDYKIAGLEVTYKNGGGPDVVIPSMIGGMKVVAIADYAITGKKVGSSGAYSGLGITSVVIPNTVTKIGNYAFFHNQLAEVTIPSSVTSIGFESFYDNQLKEIIIPSSVTNIDSEAFAHNQLVKITFPTTPLIVKCAVFKNNPITNGGTYAYPSNVTEECIPE